MAFQNNSGTIIIDAVLTDLGRKKMTQGRFKVSHFGLGDDEIDYSLGDINNGNYELLVNPPILEAFGGQNANIHHGLLDLPRNDVLLLPVLTENSRLEGAVKKRSDRFHLSVNRETTNKLKSDIGFPRILQNESLTTNVIVVESGIQQDSNNSIDRTKNAQERYLLNLGLMDKYMFVYCDSRFVDHILINQPDAYYKNDAKNNFYTNMKPLVKVVKTSIGGLIENYETYNCTAMNNEIYNIAGSNGNDYPGLSAIKGPRGTALALNFKLVDRLVNSAASQSDDRFAVFGTLNEAVFGGSNKYDYIDTNVMIEGASSGRQLQLPIRIIRYRGT
jgi:hypothetical protein